MVAIMSTTGELAVFTGGKKSSIDGQALTKDDALEGVGQSTSEVGEGVGTGIQSQSDSVANVDTSGAETLAEHGAPTSFKNGASTAVENVVEQDVDGVAPGEKALSPVSPKPLRSGLKPGMRAGLSR